MKFEDAAEIKDKSDNLFVGFNDLLRKYESVLNPEDYLNVRLHIGNILGLMYFDCLKTYVYLKYPELEPRAEVDSAAP
jgi:hypothetical protein